MSNMKNTASKSLSSESETVYWMPPLSSETSENLIRKVMPEHIREWLTSLPGDSHVSPFQLPGNKKARTIQEICGRKQSIPFAWYDPDTSLVRTSQGSLLLGICPEYSQTWPKLGMMLGGKFWVQTMSGQGIGGKGCGYWLTPHASDGEGGIMKMHKDKLGHYKLRDHVQPKNKDYWPTPNQSDATTGAILNENTEFIQKGNRIRKLSNSGGDFSVSLGRMVKIWPTPSASTRQDTVSGGHPGLAGGSGNRNKLYKMLGKQEGKKMGCQQINPDWVEWLMGWPIGWSDLEPITELIWLDWSVDPADLESDKTWPSPRAGNPGSRPNQKGGKILAEEAKKAEMWRTPSQNEPGINPNRLEPINGGELGGMNRHFDKETGRMAQLGVTQQAILRGKGLGAIPRIATNIPNRVNRLKAIGNGQCPQCAATVWTILNEFDS